MTDADAPIASANLPAVPVGTSPLNLGGRSLVIVSNREPFRIKRDANSLSLERTTGGLVSALDPVVQRSKGRWICWDGGPETDNLDDLCRLAELNGIEIPYPVQTVPLTTEDIQQYYFGYANRQIWPLFHYFPSRFMPSADDWDGYARVNRKFADAVLSATSADDYVWIQDYHLLLVPQAVRESRPNARLGFFCHIPFPQFELFRLLPNRLTLLDGMLGADLIGFHTDEYADYFMDCACRLLPHRVTRLGKSRLTVDHRTVTVGTFPISIDTGDITTLANTPETAQAVTQIRSDYGAVDYLGLGVDRLDYSKGILERLECIALFFEKYPEYRRRLVFVQIAVPSRTEVPEYQTMKQAIDEAVGRINGQFSEDGWVPIHYLYRGLPLSELVAYYRAADFALVNPLRDGMNLVAKEYCAARTENGGALILSELTGAAAQMGADSLMVNPWDPQGVVAAIHQALTMPEADRQARMGRLRHGVLTEDIAAWVNHFMSTFQEAADRV